MSDRAFRDQIETLQKKVEQLEADRLRPQTVEVAGFDGLRSLSEAIENKNLNAFMLDRSMSTKQIYRWVLGPMLLVALILVIAAAASELGF